MTLLNHLLIPHCFDQVNNNNWSLSKFYYQHFTMKRIFLLFNRYREVVYYSGLSHIQLWHKQHLRITDLVNHELLPQKSVIHSVTNLNILNIKSPTPTLKTAQLSYHICSWFFVDTWGDCYFLFLYFLSTVPLNACRSQRAWIATVADDLMTLEAIAIYGFLGMHLIAVFVLYTCFLLI